MLSDANIKTPFCPKQRNLALTTTAIWLDKMNILPFLHFSMLLIITLQEGVQIDFVQLLLSSMWHIPKDTLQ